MLLGLVEAATKAATVEVSNKVTISNRVYEEMVGSTDTVVNQVASSEMFIPANEFAVFAGTPLLKIAAYVLFKAFTTPSPPFDSIGFTSTLLGMLAISSTL
jgi:hypothetical protein